MTSSNWTQLESLIDQARDQSCSLDGGVDDASGGDDVDGGGGGDVDGGSGGDVGGGGGGDVGSGGGDVGGGGGGDAGGVDGGGIIVTVSNVGTEMWTVVEVVSNQYKEEYREKSRAVWTEMEFLISPIKTTNNETKSKNVSVLWN